jgi:hypothetical protein
MTTPLLQTVNPSLHPQFCGASGTIYEFQNHVLGTIFYPIAGIYIFTRRDEDGYWYALYVGQTDNIMRRLTDNLKLHHQFENCKHFGATHIAIMPIEGEDALRIQIETDLRHGLNPPCNLQ